MSRMKSGTDRTTARLPAASRLEWLGLAVAALTAASLWLIWSDPLRREAGTAPESASVAVIHLSAADHRRLGGWAGFFGCQGLSASDALILATVREAGQAWPPRSAVRIPLEPSPDLRARDDWERALLDEVSAIAADPAARCSARSSPEAT